MFNNFYSWLSGFIDGEGCFMLSKNGKSHYIPFFVIKLRKDDIDILEFIQKNTGIGKVFGILPSTEKIGQKPQAKWQVCKIKDCMKLVYILDRNPLRAKKKNDYKIWRDAVVYMNENGTSINDELLKLKNELSYVKKYQK